MRFKDELALTGDGDAIWRRVSDLEAIPTYWPAIGSIDILRTDGTGSVASIEFVFGGIGRDGQFRTCQTDSSRVVAAGAGVPSQLCPRGCFAYLSCE